MNFGFPILRLCSVQVLDFRLGVQDMTKKSRTALLCFRSDNRKATPQTAIENRKFLGLSVIAFVLVVTGAVAEAQQQANKVPRIGI